MTGEQPVLLGRERELARIGKVLERGRPALVVVQGKVGMGKTTLLRALETQAGASGWRVALLGRGGELAVDAGTSEEAFAAAVSELLGASAPAGPVTPEWTLPLGNDFELHVALPRIRGPRSPLEELVETLRARSPVLLLVDGFRPGPAFLERFTGAYVPALQASGAPVVTVVADRPSDVAPLAEHAELVVTLRRLDEGVVRAHFEALGRDLDPPVTGDELEEYVRSAARNPELAGSLTRVLALAGPAGAIPERRG